LVKRSGASISKVVKALIDEEPAVQDALERGYANISAVARMLRPRVEKALGRKVTLEGLITSVKRVRVDYKPSREYLKIIAGSVISLRTDVAKVSLEKTRRTLETTRRTLAELTEAFLQVLEGTTTITLVMDDSVFNRVCSMFQRGDILDEKRNLAALIVQSPREIVETPGCVVAFYNPISRAQINIEETVSCYIETIILLRMEDAGRALSILTDLIARARENIKVETRG